MSTPLIKDSSVPISRVQITSCKNGRLETTMADITNCDNHNERKPSNEANCEETRLLSPEQDPEIEPNPGTSNRNAWTRRNSVSLPAGLDAIMSEPPEYEPQVSFYFGILKL